MEDLLRDIETALRYLAHGEGTQRDAISAIKRMHRSTERRKTQVDDLAAKLAAAQAELHELRIRVGLLESWGRRAYRVCRWSTVFASDERRFVLEEAPSAVKGQPAATEQR